MTNTLFQVYGKLAIYRNLLFVKLIGIYSNNLPSEGNPIVKGNADATLQ
jgi:hypothetical protein